MGAERKTHAFLLATLALILFAARTDADPYTLGSGDVVSVKCWQREDLSGEVAVDEDGNVSLPLIGTIKARGLTPTGLGDELTRRFSLVDRGVSQIGVAVVQYNSRRVHVLGEVGQPGAYGFAQIPGLWEVIRDAGGPTALSALGRVRVVQRPGAPTLVVDLATALETGNLAGLPALEPGATIVVPRTETSVPEEAVYVLGAVADPGSFSIEIAPTLLQAILAAGGPLDNANLGSIRVVRPDALQARVFEVDLKGYTEEGRLFPNMNLLPGDTVSVSKGRDLSVWNGIWQFASKAGGFVLGTIALLAKN